MSDRRFAALPGREELASLALLTLAFAAWFGLCYGGAAALAQYTPWRVDVELPWDSRIPFWPASAVLYLTIAPMMLLAPFVLRDTASLLPLFAAFMLETTVGVAGFLLLPVDDAPVSCESATVSCGIFRVADAMNLHHNNLPSLHVAFACTLALAFAPRASFVGAHLLYAWALAVAASTLFTHQHFLLDVVAGMVLAVVGWRLAGSWARRPEVARAFDAELLAVRNISRMVTRHRRYLFIGMALYGSSLGSWRRHRMLRVGFAFLQSLDDILDGDRASDREPLEVADALRVSLKSGVFAQDPLARMGATFREELLARGGEEALGDGITLVDAMRNDRRRVLEREESTREQLRELHRRTFTHSVNLMLRAADSPLRAAALPEFIDALGWCSTVRDLREDLAHGLINVPVDVLVAARAERPEVALAELIHTSAVQEWLRKGRAQAASLLDRVDASIQALGNQRGAGVLGHFARSMRRFTRP